VKVRKLSLKAFRNIQECEFRPSPGLNFLLGANGQGKTSFLEALGYLATLRSFRGAKAPEVIQKGQSASDISCELYSDTPGSLDWNTELRVFFQMTDPVAKRAKKTAFVNSKPFHSSTQYLSQRFGNFELGFHTVIFNPSDHDLVRGDPGTRRAFIDQVISAEDVEYLKTIQKYQRVLEQKNALLRSADGQPSPDAREVLRGFNEQLGQLAATIAFKRLSYIQRLAPLVDDIVHKIAPLQRPLRLFYVSSWVPNFEELSLGNGKLDSVHFAGQSDRPSLEHLEQVFWMKLSTLESAEWRTGHSLVGPHRDDWSFFLGDEPLKGYGSQGEVRSALLALKLSEMKLFLNQTGHRPLFLLDDFSSELDRDRRSFLLRFLEETDLQVFVTTTEDSFSTGKRFYVSNGNLFDAPAVAPTLDAYAPLKAAEPSN
jgi:DNA replication and repair protein RecF